MQRSNSEFLLSVEEEEELQNPRRHSSVLPWFHPFRYFSQLSPSPHLQESQLYLGFVPSIAAMTRRVKREPNINASSRSKRSREASSPEELKSVKRERSSRNGVDSDDPERDRSTQLDGANREVLRSRYLAVKNLINDEKDELLQVGSDKFNSIFSEVESLHQLVQKPREQVADAEALLDIANSLVCSAKSYSGGGFPPSDFVTCLLREFGRHEKRLPNEGTRDSVVWKDIGLVVSPIFRKCQGCSTMFGPMNAEVKKPKVAVIRKVTALSKGAWLTQSYRPEEVHDEGAEEKTDTDNNLSAMFDILKKKKIVKLESLLLNRKSFAQTVENLFALSFLVKDGRVEVNLDGKGSHIVSPRNAPAAHSVMLSEAVYSHFAFRFDFNDWKLMVDLVPVGEELMPHRGGSNIPGNFQAALPTLPIRRVCRNRGRLVHEPTVANYSELGAAADTGGCWYYQGKHV